MSSIITFLVGQAILIFGGLISIYVKVSLKLKELEIRVQMVEKHEDIIASKLDAIQTTLNGLAISIQNKADRG